MISIAHTMNQTNMNGSTPFESHPLKPPTSSLLNILSAIFPVKMRIIRPMNVPSAWFLPSTGIEPPDTINEIIAAMKPAIPWIAVILASTSIFYPRENLIILDVIIQHLI